MTDTDMRSRAIALGRKGFQVFPVEIDGKIPTVPKFYAVATKVLDQIERLWSDPVTGEAQHWNIGVLMGAEFMALDVDNKGGKDGNSALAALADMGLDTNTLTAITASGVGQHLVYRLPPGVTVRNNASGRLGIGLDVKGYHGYIVGVGSVIGDGEYRWLNPDTPILDAPDWLVEMLRRPTPSANATGPGGVDPDELDKPHNILRAIDYLKRAPGAGTYQVACAVLDCGVSPETALDLMLDHWNERREGETKTAVEMLAKIDHAVEYRQNKNRPPPATAADEFEPIEIEDKPPPAGGAGKPRQKLFWFNFNDAGDRALEAGAVQLIADILVVGSQSCVYGESNSGKTFVVLDMAFAIASGRPFNGKPVKQGAAVYIASEGGPGIHKRIAALQKASGLRDVPLYIVPCPVDLLHGPADTEALIALVQEIESASGQKVEFIAIDTLSRALAGGDENSSVDMGTFIKHVDALRAATRAHLCIVHHTGKDKARGARGWSGLRAAIDTEIEVEPGRVQITKQRDIERGEDMTFKLVGMHIGTAADGVEVRSAVVEWTGGAAEDFEPMELTGLEDEWMEAIENWAKDQAAKKGTHLTKQKITYKVLEEIFLQEMTESGTPSLVLGRTTLQARMKALTEKRRTKKVARGQWVIAMTENDGVNDGVPGRE